MSITMRIEYTDDIPIAFSVYIRETKREDHLTPTLQLTSSDRSIDRSFMNKKTKQNKTDKQKLFLTLSKTLSTTEHVNTHSQQLESLRFRHAFAMEKKKKNVFREPQTVPRALL